MIADPIFQDTMAGRSEAHLALLGGSVLLHRDVLVPFMRLQQAAAAAGFDLQVASGFRSYQRQLAIWNAKAEGSRPLLDTEGNPLDPTRLGDKEKALVIMRWSALPGCSRHHWGTDMDLWDRAAVAADYSLQLVASEYSSGGPFAPLSDWLEHHAGEFGFYRPYDRDRGGVAPEPWHWSYRPVAAHFEAQLNRAFICKVLDNGDLKLREVIQANLDEIAARFILPPNRETHA